MSFWETVGAGALGASIPVLLSRFLDRRDRRKETTEFAGTGTGRYMNWVLSEMDKSAGEMVDRVQSETDEPR